MFEGRLPSFANTRSMRVAGGLGTVARVVGDAQEIYGQRIPVDDAHPAHREAVQALSPGVAPAVHARPPRFRRGGADRLPFHAVDRRLQGRAAARRRGAGRPLRHELRRGGRRDDRGDAARRWAIRSAATSPMRAASSPSITATRPPACMRSSSRSTARSTWTSGATSARRRFARLAADLETLADAWPRFPIEELRPYRAAARIVGDVGNRLRQEKGPLADASGPSLGRKRPRRAAVTRGATALQQHAPRRTKSKGKSK